MKIDYSKIKNDRTVIRCNTKEKAIKLITNSSVTDKDKWIKYWETYETQTCYILLTNGDINGYSPIYYFEENHYTILQFDDVIVDEIPKTLQVLNLEKGCEITIDGYNANPCYINDDNKFVNSFGNEVKCSWLAKMIDDKCKYSVKRRKKMTLKEIENELGYQITLVD